MLFYNTKLVPVPPADTAGLIATASKLTGQGQYGLGMNALDPLWAIPWLSAYGGWPTDDEGRPTLNTDPMVQTLTFMYNLGYRSKVISPTMEYDAGLAAFKSGKIAMWIDGEWALSALQNVKDVQWGVARLPVLTDSGVEPACLIGGKVLRDRRERDGPETRRGPAARRATRRGPTARTLGASFACCRLRSRCLSSAQIQDDPFLRVSATQMLAGRGVGLSERHGDGDGGDARSSGRRHGGADRSGGSGARDAGASRRDVRDTCRDPDGDIVCSDPDRGLRGQVSHTQVLETLIQGTVDHDLNAVESSIRRHRYLIVVAHDLAGSPA